MQRDQIPRFIARCAVFSLTLYLGGFSVPVHAQGDREAAGGYYEDGLVRFRNDDVPGAIIQLKNALQQDPELLSAHLLLAKAYLRLGDALAAEDALSAADRLGADSSVTVVLRAEADLIRYRYRALIDSIDPHRYEPDVGSDLLVLQGRAHLELGELAEAQQAFTTAARLNPGNDAARAGLATALLRLGDVDGAEEQVRRAIAIDSESAGGWAVKASVSQARGALQDAIAEYGKAIAIEPRHLDARISRAAILMELDQDIAAAADLDFVREEFPLDPRAAYLRAVLYARNGEQQQAEQALRESVNIIERLGPTLLSTHPQLLLIAGLSHYSLNQFEQAEDYLKRYIDRNRNHVGARKLLGSILVYRSEYRRAIQTLEPALDRSPSDYRLLALLGTAYMHEGRHLLATQLLEKAATLSRGAPDIRTQLAMSRLGAGEERAAMEEFTSVLEQDAGNVEAAAVLAALHLERGEFEQAASVAQAINAREPENLTALNLLGMARVGGGRFDDARKFFETAIGIDSAFLPARISLAKLDMLERKPQPARRHLVAILDEYPKYVPAMFELAKVEDYLGRTDESIRLLEKARSIDPLALSAILYLVDLYLRTGDPQAALNVADEARIRLPENLDVMAAIGRSYLALHKVERARAIFRRMTELAGYDARVLFRIARYQMTAGAQDDARWSLQKAVQDDPGFVPAQVALTEMQLRAGSIDAALERAEALTARHPDQASGYRLSGDVLMHEQRYAEAAQRYRAALDREARTDLAIRLYHATRLAGRDDEALRLLQAWNESHPEDLPAMEALAEAYLRGGDLDAARRHYEQVLARAPDSANALNNLANIHAKAGDPGALQYAEKAHALAPESAAIADTLGWLLVEAGDPARGLRYLRDAHSRASSDPEIRYHIAVALVQLDRGAEARVELDEALGAGQTFEGIEQARALRRKLAE